MVGFVYLAYRSRRLSRPLGIPAFRPSGLHRVERTRPLQEHEHRMARKTFFSKGDDQQFLGTGTRGGHAPRNALGTTSLTLGILSMLLALIPGIGDFLSLLLGVPGVFFGVIGRSRVRAGVATNGATARWGIITSVVGLLIMGSVLGFGIYKVVSHPKQYQAYSKCLAHARTTSAQQTCLTQFNAAMRG